ncbi:MAG: hypothetical protein ACFE0J_06195 [Elainellaceae cyanobacterium]
MQTQDLKPKKLITIQVLSIGLLIVVAKYFLNQLSMLLLERFTSSSG